MTDESVDRALRQLALELDNQPSAEFAAVIRARMSAGRSNVVSRGSWPLWTATVGLAVAAALMLVATTYKPKTIAVTPTASVDAAKPAQALTPGTGLAFRPGEADGIRGPRDAPKRSRAGVPAPTDQALALDRLLLGLRSGRTAVPAETRAPVDRDGLLLAREPIKIRLIHIAPVEIEPLPGIELLAPWEGQR